MKIFGFIKNGSIVTIDDSQVFLVSGENVLDLQGVDLDDAFDRHYDLVVMATVQLGCLKRKGYVNLRAITDATIFDGKGGTVVFSSLNQLVQELRGISLRAHVRYFHDKAGTLRNIWRGFTIVT